MGENERRRAERFRKQYLSAAYIFYIKLAPCIVPECRRIPDAAHAVSKGAGGTWKHLFPCCHEHHMEQHNTGMQTFMAKYNVDPRMRAEELAAGWLDHPLRDREV